MNDLEKLYYSISLQSNNMAIPSFNSTRPEWLSKKRKLRRSNKQELKNVSKTDLSS